MACWRKDLNLFKHKYVCSCFAHYVFPPYFKCEISQVISHILRHCLSHRFKFICLPSLPCPKHETIVVLEDTVSLITLVF